MTVTIIVAMTADRLIGSDGQLPWHLPDDLKFFKRTTTGHAIVMGRLTFESIGRVLPGRRNIVITRNRDYSPETDPAPVVVHSMEAAIAWCRDNGEEKVFIIGGAKVYAESLSFADEMLITHVGLEGVTGDTYFPEWDAGGWEQVGPADDAYPDAIRYRRR